MIKLSSIPTAEEIQAVIDHLKALVLVEQNNAKNMGYRRFIGVLSQTGIQDPTIEQVIVNDVNLTNADLKYDDTGIYVIRRPDLMTGLWNQAGVGVVGNNDERTYWVMYPYDSTNQIYFNTYSLDDMALRDDILGFLVELRFPL